MKLITNVPGKVALRFWVLFAGLILTAWQMTAQTTVSGSVRDGGNNEPLAGVNVLVKGTGIGTVTDVDGNFSVNVPADATTLIFSYIGYLNVEEAINNRTTIEVQLREDATSLDEVVVVGYGQVAKKDLSTSVGSARARDIKDQPVNSVDQAIMGKIAGVRVQQTSGSPGAGLSVRVRGIGSITAGNEPLYVIDGVPVSSDNNRANQRAQQYQDQPVNILSTLNPNDIESIQVLKDASAAAIYGSRGSNGVILITTKKGSVGRPVVAYNAYYGLQEVSKTYDLLNAYEWSQFNFEGRNNTYKDRFPAGRDTDDNATRARNVPNQGAALIPAETAPYLNGQAGLTDTDWQDELFRTAPIQSHNVAVSGGTEGFRYYASGEYMDQQGIIISTGFKRYSGRFNMDLNHNRLKVGLNINPTVTEHDLVNSEGPWSDEAVVALALAISPIWPVYNPDGTYNFGANAWAFGSTNLAMTDFINPVALANEVQDNMQHMRLLGNAYAEYSILKNLSYRLSFGADINNFRREYYRPSTVEAIGRKGPSIPIGLSNSRFTTNWLVENLLNYNTTFGRNSLSAVAGFSSQKETFFRNEIAANNYPNDLVPTLNAGQITGGNSFEEAWTLLSGLARVQYNFDSKYYLSAAIRADGSSRFGANNKWGYFPSVSAAWRVTGEDFLKSNALISNLKLRASYGQTGNFQIGNYGSIGLLNYDDYVLGGNLIASGLAPTNPSNPNLSWERTSSVNFGVDFGLLQDAVYLELDYYIANTNDLLLNVPVPQSSGFSTELRNIGEVQNRGFEAALTWQGRRGAFGWSLSGNFSTNRNEVISLAPGVPQILTTSSLVLTALWITKPGEPIGSYFNPVYDGVFNNQAELDANPKVPNARPGDLRFLDVNGDGRIDFATDRMIQGNYLPDYTIGATLNLEFKGFDLNAAVQGVYGHEILNLLRRFNYNQEGNMNLVRGALNRWVSESQPGDGQTNRANRLQTGSNGQTSNWHLEDASFTRIRNLTLGYTFPRTLMGKAKISNLRTYVTVQNPFTFTNYSGYNPEVNSRPDSALNPGEDYGTYPLARTYTFGVNLSF
jgi:TonB-linked SusC/RagA family outer membrane protein